MQISQKFRDVKKKFFSSLNVKSLTTILILMKITTRRGILKILTAFFILHELSKITGSKVYQSIAQIAIMCNLAR